MLLLLCGGVAIKQIELSSLAFKRVTREFRGEDLCFLGGDGRWWALILKEQGQTNVDGQAK